MLNYAACVCVFESCSPLLLTHCGGGLDQVPELVQMMVVDPSAV